MNAREFSNGPTDRQTAQRQSLPEPARREHLLLAMASLRFSLDKVASPAKAAQTKTDAPPRKVPRLSDLIIQGPKPPPMRRSAENANVDVAIYKITDDASLVWDECKGRDFALWQIQTVVIKTLIFVDRFCRGCHCMRSASSTDEITK